MDTVGTTGILNGASLDFYYIYFYIIISFIGPDCLYGVGVVCGEC